MPLRARFLLFAAGVLFAALPGSALAQPTSATARPPASDAPRASHDGAAAVSENPSLVPLLGGWSLAYTHVHGGEALRALRADEATLRESDSVFAASSLPFGLGAGLSYENVRATTSGRLPDGSVGPVDASRDVWSLVLGWSPGATLSFGSALRWSHSTFALEADVASLDLGATWRPWPWLGVSLMSLDAVRTSVGGVTAPRSFVLATALRPTGARHLTLGLEAAIDTEGYATPRAALELEIPYVGRLRGGFAIDDVFRDERRVRFEAGLEVSWGMLAAGGGMRLARDADGQYDDPGWYVHARIDQQRREGLPTGSRVDDLLLESMSPRSLLATIARLERDARDDDVAGVLIRLRGTSLSLAEAQEMRSAIAHLRRNGKRVLCHLDAATGGDYYACAAADRVLGDPAGGVRLVGIRSESYYLGESLRRIGVRAQFVRIGDYKSAPEQLMFRRPTAASRRQRSMFLDDAYARFVADLARDRRKTPEEMRRLIDEGPYLTEELVRLGLFDGEADEADLDDHLRRLLGRSVARATEPPSEAASQWGRPRGVAVILIDGDIVDGRSMEIPFVGIRMSGGRTIAESIDAAAADSRIGAIVVRVDSGGGSALASDQIWRAIQRARRRKPVVATMGAVAASGGYYIACGANTVWTDPSTLTGSIGIFFGKVDVSGLARRVGLGVDFIDRGRRASAESFFRPFTRDERETLASRIALWYRLFLRRVASSRRMSRADVDQIGQGRIWSGDRAIGLGLADRRGGFMSALVDARRRGGLAPDAPVYVMPAGGGGLLGYLLGSLSVEEPVSRFARSAVPDVVRRAVMAATPLVMSSPGVPHALVEERIELR
ncbi:MAG: S49 family peptidase [Deltaproteobacteria bacterium]|nr:S49 family peptidase [Deltaproteobacteria bacterium]